MNWLKRVFRQQPSDDTEPAQSNAYLLIGGDKTIRAIARQFYSRMQQGEDTQALLSLHPQNLEHSEQKLYEFLSGWLGGPQLFQQKYGHPALRARHMPFAINDAMRDQWLVCMDHALRREVPNDEYRQAIYQAIATLADHMRNQ